MVRLSEKDLHIIKRLRENARTRFTEMARELGITEAAVRKRVKKLEDEGVIRGYTLDVDPAKLGYNVVAFIGFDVMPERYARVVEVVKKFDEVKKLYSTTGDHMFMALVWLRNREELERFVEKLEAVEGVVKVCPAIVVEEIK